MADRDFSQDLDDWETLDDTGELDKQIDALKLSTKVEKEMMESAPNDSYNLEFGRVKILQNNEQRTQYTPTIKLLKRDPTADNASNNSNMGERKPSYKSLQQREQEYAEARKRILGCPSGERNGTETSNSSNADNSPKIAQRAMANAKSVTRQPNGPDSNSKGFQSRRGQAESS